MSWKEFDSRARAIRTFRVLALLFLMAPVLLIITDILGVTQTYSTRAGLMQVAMALVGSQAFTVGMLTHVAAEVKDH